MMNKLEPCPFCGNPAEWIKCSERMPLEKEQSADVFDIVTLAVTDNIWHKASELSLVTVADEETGERFVCDDMTVDGEWVNFTGSFTGRFTVTHWMPMPEPAEDDKEKLK